MRILYLDTSSSYLYAGIVSNDILIEDVKVKLDKELSIFTLPKIVEMLEKHNLKPNDIDKIIVVNGPGSFTGIRIGITIAKTLAWTLKKEIVTISSLEAMALSKEDYSYIVPAINARRGYVFAGVYDQNRQVVIENQHILGKELQKELNKLESDYVIVTNDEVDLEGKKILYNPDILKIVQTYQNKQGINPHAIEPNYLKLTEAEESKQESC